MSLNSIDGLTNKVNSKVNGVESAVNNVQSKAADAVNRVQNSVDGVKRGIDSATNLYDKINDKAGETYNAITGAPDTIKSKFGNLFGGGDMATSAAVAAPGSGASGTSPATRIAGFANAPGDTLPSIDPLKREVSEPFKAANAAAEGVMDYLKPGKAGSLLSAGFDKLKSIRDTALATVGTDYASVKKRLENTMQIAGQLAKLPGDIQQEIYGYTSAFQQTKNEITAQIDGVKQTFDSFKDFDDYLAIDQVIKSFTGNSGSISNLDLNTSSALIFGLSSSLTKYGLPGKTDAMVEAITDPVAKPAMYGELLVQASSVGNLDSVEYYMGKLIEGQGRSLADTVIPNLLTNLQVDLGVGYKAYGARVLAVCDTLNPAWDKTKDDPTMTELLPYTYCNNGALQSLLTTAKRPYVCAAGNRRLVSVDVIVDQFFPV